MMMGESQDSRLVQNEIVDGRAVAIAGTEEVVPADVLVRSIGYDVPEFPGLPYDTAQRCLAHEDGRIPGPEFVGCYVAGWAAFGPDGVLGRNKTTGRIVVGSILEDVERGVISTDTTLPEDDIGSLLRSRGVVRWMDKAQWRRVREKELGDGVTTGRTAVRMPEDQMFTYLESLSELA